MKFINTAAALIVAAALSLTACGTGNGTLPTDPEVEKGNVVNPYVVPSEAPAEAPVAQAPAAVPGEATVADVIAGQANACDLLNFDDVGIVFDGSYTNQSVGNSTYCTWNSQDGNRTLALEVTREAWIPSVMQRFSNEPGEFKSPCPEFGDAIYGHQGANIGIWCQRNDTNMLLELKYGVGADSASSKQEQALGPLMEQVLAKAA